MQSRQGNYRRETLRWLVRTGATVPLKVFWRSVWIAESLTPFYPIEQFSEFKFSEFRIGCLSGVEEFYYSKIHTVFSLFLLKNSQIIRSYNACNSSLAYSFSLCTLYLSLPPGPAPAKSRSATCYYRAGTSPIWYLWILLLWCFLGFSWNQKLYEDSSHSSLSLCCVHRERLPSLISKESWISICLQCREEFNTYICWNTQLVRIGMTESVHNYIKYLLEVVSKLTGNSFIIQWEAAIYVERSL